MIELRQVLQTTLVAIVLGAGVLLPAHARDRRVTSPASSQQTPSARPWISLSTTQRDLLAPLQPTWDTLSARRQAHMLRRAEHWATLPAKRRAEIREHIAHWQQMSPQEREQARANRRKFHDMSAQQREHLHATFERFQHLPPAQRDKLRREWRALTPEQRLHWSVPSNAPQTPDAPADQPAAKHSEPSAPPQPAH